MAMINIGGREVLDNIIVIRYIRKKKKKQGNIDGIFCKLILNCILDIEERPCQIKS